uniref:Uncharacterized protein n=1 Tax=Ditylenchus dipsaci TaxID=166011 RepID=A0A915D1A5_9BILA
MNKILFEPQEFNRLYNCNNFHIEEVPLEKRQHFYKSVILIVLTTIYYILYVPCIISIYKHRECSCYKILLFMSIADVCNLWLLGYVHGYLSIIGAVYCSSPTFLYVTGVVATALWATESIAETILSLNRCLIILSKSLEARLFGGWRTYIWLSVAFAYFALWMLFVKPVIFTSLHFTWSCNPYAGYVDDVHGDVCEH